MKGTRIVACLANAFILLTASACDLVVEAGQTTVLGNRGSVFGSGGSGMLQPLPAVRVQPSGTVVVEDADVFGGGTVRLLTDTGTNSSAAPGIFADRGSVRVQAGLVRGGAIVTDVPGLIALAQDGIVVASSTLEIQGGTIRGGGVASSLPVGNIPGTGVPRLQPGAGVFAIDSDVLVTGGSFLAGQAATTGTIFSSFEADNSDVTVRGGDFDLFGPTFFDSRARILGGRFSNLLFDASDNATADDACSEIRGGQIEELDIFGPGPVFLFGSGFSLPPGRVPPSTSRVTGVLQDGTPLDVRVRLAFGGGLTLGSPGSPGCPQ